MTVYTSKQWRYRGREAQTRRNAEMLLLRESGESVAAIAARYDLSTGYVRNLLSWLREAERSKSNGPGVREVQA